MCVVTCLAGKVGMIALICLCLVRLLERWLGAWRCCVIWVLPGPVLDCGERKRERVSYLEWFVNLQVLQTVVCTVLYKHHRAL